ncbi:MAG: alpha/beta hydrolase, partial [Alphaproteobacteria bacterium]|nr:alpha/beta hydrolase [Alphaproteobacteria bacterium]
ILVAPAVWGRSTMNPFYRFSLWFSAHVTPGATLTGRGLKRRPSDNIEMLIALGRDPLVIKATRIDAVYGLMGLMDAALDAVPRASVPLLVLYGENDEIIPPHATQRMLEIMDSRNRVAVYPQGWHMLLRDLSARVPQDDVLAWIADAASPLPSGADQDARRRLAEGFKRRPSLPLTAGR